MRLGAVEMDEGNGSSADGAVESYAESYDDRMFMSLNAISRLELAVEYCRLAGPDGQKLGSGKRSVPVNEFLQAGLDELEIMQQLRLFEQAREQIAMIKSSQAHDLNLSDLLTPWRDLDFDLSHTGTRETVVFVGAFQSSEALQTFQGELAADAPETYVSILEDQDTSVRAVVATLRSNEGIVLGNLRRHGFHLLPAMGLQGTPAQILAQIEKRSADNISQLAKLELELAELTASGKEFELLHDFYLMRSDKIEALRNLPGTANTFYLTGWVPANISQQK